MPLYECQSNALNRIENAPIHWANKTVTGIERIAQFTASEIEKSKIKIVAIDGWLGVNFSEIVSSLRDFLKVDAVFLSMHQFYHSEEIIRNYKKEFITDDAAFGWSNNNGKLDDLIDLERMDLFIQNLLDNSNQTTLIMYGPGSAKINIENINILRIYCDMSQQKFLWKMWEGNIVPFFSENPDPNYHWKEYYYNDFYLLHAHKKNLIQYFDYYIDCSDNADLKILPAYIFHEIIERLVQYPIKQVKIFQPGPWGAYRYKDLFDVPGLGCNAWNELAGPELNILVEIGKDIIINMPVTNLLCHAELFVGNHIAKTLPDMLPFDVWLNDGYFPDPVPQERSSMPIHNHPSTNYVSKNFNEPLGRYETYYIAEAYQGANTLMGFHENADYELWKEKCYESEKNGMPIEDWKNYIKRWETNVGDLFLIPPGTTHGHGGNQMVLEMDTSASPCGTEYSYFMYDFCRPSWDDTKKSMTGKPLKMHTKHGFNVDECRRENWVKENLFIRQPKVIHWTKEFAIDRYNSYGPMPFEIERIHFTKRAEYSTYGKFMHIPTLTVGNNVLIRSKKNQEYSTSIDIWQACLIPACFGDYEIINLSEGLCTLVLIRWKIG